jgi:hypothetical protein
MLKKIIGILVIVVSIVSCKSNNGFKYSQDFVASEKKLMLIIETTEKKVEAYIALKQYDSMAFVSEKLENAIEETIKDAKTKPAADAKDGEKFKVDVIKYFEFLKSVYTSYKDFGNATTDNTRQEEVVKLQKLISKKTDVVKIIQTAQKNFAKANGFRIEE